MRGLVDSPGKNLTDSPVSSDDPLLGSEQTLPRVAVAVRTGDRSVLQIGRGSANKLEYHLLLSGDLHLLAEENFQNLEGKAGGLQRMLTALTQRFNAESIVK
jgi:hypothetical protein